jgi:hypothetical protein
MEIQRIYGKGMDIGPMDAPNTGMSDQTGYSHALDVFPFKGGFKIAPSGCVSRFNIGQRIN